ncbi:hypothetical protein PIIN_06068 [Serendipita indica DSM 11827]|uniref:CBM1 domain-containing protein n=1 Tax=Serendipita indica (strain DSM 11827) TaxID=1109443 RepID=G4TLD9_SERID|nr:hypothetical protein PIIN_06068 [Serendipita indica DSM 11827]
MRLSVATLYALAFAGTSVAYTTPKKSSTSSRSSTSSVKSTIVTSPGGYPYPPSSSTTTSTVTGLSPVWGQCGGRGFMGPTACAGSICVYYNVSVSQQMLPAQSQSLSLETGKPTSTAIKKDRSGLDDCRY